MKVDAVLSHFAKYPYGTVSPGQKVALVYVLFLSSETLTTKPKLQSLSVQPVLRDLICMLPQKLRHIFGCFACSEFLFAKKVTLPW